MRLYRREALCFFFVLFILLPSFLFAQDSLEVSCISIESYNFDSVGQIANDGRRLFCCVNDSAINVAFYDHYHSYLNEFSLYNTSDTLYKLVFANDRLFAANDDAGLVCFQIPDSRITSTISSVTSYGKCFDIEVQDNDVFMTTDSGFYALNYNNPSSPILYGSIEQENGFIQIAIGQTTAYVLSPDNNLNTIDISDLNNLQLSSSLPLDVPINGLFVYNDALYTTSETSGLKVYSISNPLAPSLLEAPDIFDSVYYFFARNDTAWVSLGDEGISVIDVTIPDQLTVLTQYSYPSVYTKIIENGLITNSNDGFYTLLNINNPDSVYKYDEYGNSHILDFSHHDYLSFVCDDVRGLRLFDMTWPECPMESALTNGDDKCSRFASEDTVHAYLTTDSLVAIFSTHYYHQSDIHSRIQLPSQGTDLHIKNQHLYVTMEEGGCIVYDIHDLNNPQFLYDLGTEYSLNGIGTYFHLLCLSGLNGELLSYDISDTDSPPVFQSILDIGTLCYDVHVLQNFAFVCCGEDGVKIVDLYDPRNPEVVTTIDTDGTAYDITNGGWYFYIADGLNGVRVYDIQDPYNPQLVGYYDTPGNALRVFAWHENCGVADEDAFIVLRYANATDTQEEEQQLPSDFRIDSVYPNPFNPNCNVKINIPESGLMSLKVFNTLGQEVSSLSETPVKAGSFEYQFFGKNQASGVYILKVELEGFGMQTSKLVLMK